MTLLTRWEPFRESSTMQDRMSRMNRLFRESYSPEVPEEALTTTNFAPPVDIYEDEHTITLKLDVPGIAEKDIDVRIEALNTDITSGEQYGIRTVWLCGRPYRSADETLSPKDVRPTYTIRAFRQLPLLLQRIRDTEVHL